MVLHKVSMPSLLFGRNLTKAGDHNVWRLKINNDVINLELTNFDSKWNIFNPTAHIKEI